MTTTQSIHRLIGGLALIAVLVPLSACDQGIGPQETPETVSSEEPTTAPSTSKQMAEGESKFVGSALTSESNIPSNFSTYWNQVTPENAGKWGSLEPSQGNWNWGPLENVYNYAQNNGFPFRQHTFVWGSQEPDWISNEDEGTQRGALEYFVEEYFNRFPDTDMVDVVNEPLHRPPSYASALGGDGSTGWDWVITSFEIAQQYNTGAELMINDYGIISDPNAARDYREIINLLNDRGLIDAIGLQCHAFNMDDVSTSTINQVLDILAQTGLPIYVTELDMRGSDSQQLQRYQEKFPVLYEHPAVEGVTLWGYREGEHWEDGAHLIRSDGSVRPALQWLQDTYFGSSGDDGGNTGSGDNTVVVRARGESGSEEINVRVDEQTVGTFTLSTNYQTYTVNTNLTGTVDVEFYNDASGRDVQVDYAEVNGETRQAEDQQTNTAAYDGSCGGGSYTEWMHCNGIIEFGTLSGGGSSGNSFVVRAQGTSGEEELNLRIDEQTIATFTLSTSYQTYTASSTLSGTVDVEFYNDASGRDVQVDYVEVNGQTRQAEDQQTNTAAWDGSCGGGSYTEWMQCNGIIEFGGV